MRFLVVAIVALCLFGFIHHLRANEFADQTWDSTSAQRSEHANLEGNPMPSLDVDGWLNATVTPEDMKGKVVVIDFYATWCGPCMAAIPHNNDLFTKYISQGLIVIGVCTDQGQDQFEQVATQHHIQYPIARDPNFTAAKTWHVHYYPTYAIIDRKGIVRVIGLQPQYVEDAVKKLLSEN